MCPSSVLALGMSSKEREQPALATGMPDVFGARSGTAAGSADVSARRDDFAEDVFAAVRARRGAGPTAVVAAFVPDDSRGDAIPSARALHCRREPSAEITCQVERGAAVSSDNEGAVAGAHGAIAFFGDAVLAGSGRYGFV